MENTQHIFIRFIHYLTWVSAPTLPLHISVADVSCHQKVFVATALGRVDSGVGAERLRCWGITTRVLGLNDSGWGWRTWGGTTVGRIDCKALHCYQGHSSVLVNFCPCHFMCLLTKPNLYENVDYDLLYPRPTKLEGGYTGFTLSVCPSVRPSVCL